jgi:sn-glycerol 3-phosphate transport system ATP-binding protein
VARVRLCGVGKTYPGGVAAIQHIDLDVGDGELIVLVGPSGCGKSTLLRMVAGLETVTTGEIALDGRIVNQLEPAERDIAMVFQNYALYPHMSVYDNMAYGLRNRRTPKAEIERRVRNAAAILGIEELLRRRPRQLSGGQRQRVAMGRAIVREPKVFLFDEPLSNLDAKLRAQMRVEIKRLQRGLGTTSLYVTHDQMEAMTLGDRLLVLNGGVVEQLGTPLDVYRRPASVFVAGFIGSPAMNLLPATVGADGQSMVIGCTRIPLNGITGIRPETAVTLGVRPEHLRPVAGAAAGMFELGVDLAEALGADTLVHGRLAGSGPAVTARLHGAALPAAGEMMPLAFDVGDLHLFDASSGRRLER